MAKNAKVSVVVPLAPLAPDAYVQRHVEVVFDEPQARALRMLTNALEADGTQLANGRTYVRGPGHALKWLMEQVGGVKAVSPKPE